MERKVALRSKVYNGKRLRKWAKNYVILKTGPDWTGIENASGL